MEAKRYCVYFDYTGAGRRPEPVAGPFDTYSEAFAWYKDHGYESDDNYFVDVEYDDVNESVYEPLQLLREMLQLDEAEKKKKKKVSKVAAKAVYHRDYVKTKKKPYRKYDPAEYAADKRD